MLVHISSRKTTKLQFAQRNEIDVLIDGIKKYTSKSSYLDGDVLPEYKSEHPYTVTFSGKRIHRYLYISGSIL